MRYCQSGCASSRPAPLGWLASSRYQCPSFPHHVEHCVSVLACLVSQRQAFCVPRWRDVSSIVRPSCSSWIRLCRPILLFVSLSSPHLPFITDHLSRPLLHLPSSLARLCDVACNVVSHSLTLSSFFAQADLWPRIAANAGTVV